MNACKRSRQLLFPDQSLVANCCEGTSGSCGLADLQPCSEINRLGTNTCFRFQRLRRLIVFTAAFDVNPRFAAFRLQARTASGWSEGTGKEHSLAASGLVMRNSNKATLVRRGWLMKVLEDSIRQAASLKRDWEFRIRYGEFEQKTMRPDRPRRFFRPPGPSASTASAALRWRLNGKRASFASANGHPKPVVRLP